MTFAENCKLIWNINRYTVPFLELHTKISFIVLFLFMVNWMTPFVFFHFISISKSFLSFLFFRYICSPCKNWSQEKTLVPIILNRLKIKQQFGDLLGSKYSKSKKTILSPAFNYSRKMSWDNSKRDSKSILVKKKKKHFWQIEVMLFTMLKTLDWFLYWSSLLTRSQLWTRSLPTATKCMT